MIYTSFMIFVKQPSQNLSKEIEDERLRNIVFEEFKKGGAVAIEFSKEAVDKLIRRILKKGVMSFINTVDKLRAIVEWIAVGISSGMLILDPIIGIFLGFSSGAFLLLDPERR